MASSVQPVLLVENYRPFLKALLKADREGRLEFRHALKDVGEVVRADAAGRVASKNSRTAAGYKVSVTQKGVAVYQALPKTTGTGGSWGVYQMIKVLIPARKASASEINRKMEVAFDRVADHFNQGGVE